ncbi:MAG TPA: hypothetical protein DCX01_06600 [Bacteroidetes bacterium]|nr:hypothetical protein [Bacteroidota bacterium]
MKNTLLLLALGAVLLINESCQKPPVPIIIPAGNTTDTTGGGGQEEEVSPYVGSWSYDKIELTNGVLEIMGNEIGAFEGAGSDITGEVLITENPNKYTTILSFTADISVFGQAQSLPVDKQTSGGTWTESNGEITLVDDSGKNIAVVSSTSSMIVFTGEFTETIDAQFGSIDATSDVVFTIVK